MINNPIITLINLIIKASNKVFSWVYFPVLQAKCTHSRVKLVLDVLTLGSILLFHSFYFVGAALSCSYSSSYFSRLTIIHGYNDDTVAAVVNVHLRIARIVLPGIIRSVNYACA